jgi:hypothetical protein
MSLNLSKLKKVCIHGKKTTAQCPACAESGHDRRGEHLVIDAEGRFACVVYPGDSADAKEHRKRIFSLCGDRQTKVLVMRPAAGNSPSGPAKTDLLGRLGRVFETRLEPSRKIEEDVSLMGKSSDNQKGVLAVLKPVVSPNRPLTERELWLLRRAGAENDPIIITALNLFNGTIVG